MTSKSGKSLSKTYIFTQSNHQTQISEVILIFLQGIERTGKCRIYYIDHRMDSYLVRGVCVVRKRTMTHTIFFQSGNVKFIQSPSYIEVPPSVRSLDSSSF